MSGKERAALTCALYSEDGSRHSGDTFKAVVLGMCKHLVPGIKTQDRHLSFSTIGCGITGTYWKAHSSRQRGAQQRYRDLIKVVATELKRGRVVFFHVDGDSTWSEQHAADVWTSLERFRSDLRSMSQLPELEQAFLAVVPFYSMESWTFANIKLLRTRVRTAQERAYLNRWAEDLARLDEEPKIKECLPSVRSHHNLELAAGIPCAQLESARTSYEDTLQRLRNSKILVDGLSASLSRPY